MFLTGIVFVHVKVFHHMRESFESEICAKEAREEYN